VRSAADTFTARSTWVLEATGRSSTSAFAPDNERIYLDQLVAVSFVGSPLPSKSNTAENVTVIEASSTGWWYSLVLPTRQSLFVFLSDRDLLPHGKAALYGFLSEQLRRTCVTRARFESGGSTGKIWQLFDARSSIRRVAVCHGWLALGDALVAIDPLAGNGIVKSMENALDVCDWLLEGNTTESDSLPAWAARVSAGVSILEHERRQVYSVESRWPESPFWLRRTLPLNGNPVVG
jgi:2-polyprenyl-6-methoxyphenol hydroxylase-like FAD-dependent oxidoreductase